MYSVAARKISTRASGPFSKNESLSISGDKKKGSAKDRIPGDAI
jgi:hypothetical protein